VKNYARLFGISLGVGGIIISAFALYFSLSNTHPLLRGIFTAVVIFLILFSAWYKKKFKKK